MHILSNISFGFVFRLLCIYGTFVVFQKLFYHIALLQSFCGCFIILSLFLPRKLMLVRSVSVTIVAYKSFSIKLEKFSPSS